VGFGGLPGLTWQHGKDGVGGFITPWAASGAPAPQPMSEGVYCMQAASAEVRGGLKSGTSTEEEHKPCDIHPPYVSTLPRAPQPGALSSTRLQLCISPFNAARPPPFPPLLACRYSCQSLPEPSLGEVLGTCVPVPPGCGLEDGPCCPGGIYQGGFNVSEFGGFCREDGIYCTADYHGQDSDEWRCKRWPL